MNRVAAHLIAVLALLSPTTPAAPPKPCEPAGCNREICAEKGEELVSACVVLPEHACYARAKCARQKDGRCGWTPSKALDRCLSENRAQMPVFVPPGLSPAKRD